MSDLIKDPKLISAMQELGRGLKSPNDLAKLSRELLKITIEASLNAEMEEHIGYLKHSTDGYNSGNSRNGYNRKTLKGEHGEPGSRYFCESFYGHPCPTSCKNYATAYACGGPSRPASLVGYPTRGIQHRSRNDSTRFRESLHFHYAKRRFVKTHALSLLGTTRLLSRSDRD
jgi:hypothetical protein